MGPSVVEIARTLLRGRLPGLLQVSGYRSVLRVTHGADQVGRPLILVEADGNLDRALDGLRFQRSRGSATFTVDDVPPTAGAPSLGRVHVAGRLTRVEPCLSRSAALEFAESHPVPALLDVGRQAGLARLDVADVRLERDGAVHEIDAIAYLAGQPDPLHDEEADLLTDLTGHHAAAINAYLVRQLTEAGVEVTTGRAVPVRLDRYGIVVDSVHSGIGGPRRIRVNFPRPVQDRHDLAHLLHGVLFHHHTEIVEPEVAP